ncbi:MAG: hypothetical protein CVU46_14455 [Chloroflexi bacterium HGW-Chloroflexi-8]|nr:MAG: hypothetical protein CVU46_14455 [Chloroflexi bacterium HGW-Chloroflexi-8]
MSERKIELIWILKFSLIVIFITLIPYFLGFELAKNGGVTFSGFIFGVEDGNSYIAKMLLGQSGDWLFRTPYTSYPQNGFIAFLPYLFLGKLASKPEVHLQLLILFQIFRCFGIVYLIYETFYFVKLFFEKQDFIKKAVVISSVGGGLGWLLIILFTKIPLEFYSPESFGFLSILGLPHLCFSRGLMLRSFRMLIEPGADIFNLDRKLTAGFYLFMSGIFQPLNIPLGWLVIGVWKIYEYIFKSRDKILNLIKQNFAYFLIPLPFFTYNALNFLIDPYLKIWENQNIIKSPPLGAYLWAYGLGYLCLIFANLIQKKVPLNNSFILIWSIFLPFLVYFPINLQRRLADGFWIVMSIYIIFVFENFIYKKIRWAIYMTLCISSIFLLVGSINSVQNLNEPIYLSQEIIEVFTFINGDGNKNDVVLAPFNESNALPAYIPMRVVTGHGPESKNLSEIGRFVDDFYSGKINEAEIDKRFSEFQIRYVIFQKSDEGIKSLERDSNSLKLFENDKYVLFRYMKIGEM